jgi:hypothetical protein
MSEREQHLDDARCADLALGLSPDPARERDLSHAQRCTECAVRLRAHVAATFGAQAARPGAIVALPRPQRGRARRVSVAGGAAAAAALIAALLWPRTASHPPAPTMHWLATPSEGMFMRAGEDMDAHLDAGLTAYARRDLATAERELAAAHASDGAEQARRLYLAHVRLLHHDASGALALLRSLDFIELPAAVSRDAVRLLAQALRAEGEAASADSLERALARSPEWVPVLP